LETAATDEVIVINIRLNVQYCALVGVLKIMLRGRGQLHLQTILVSGRPLGCWGCGFKSRSGHVDILLWPALSSSLHATYLTVCSKNSLTDYQSA